MSESKGNSNYAGIVFEKVAVPAGPTASDRLRGFAMATRADSGTEISSPRVKNQAEPITSPGRDMWVGNRVSSSSAGRRGSHPLPQAPATWGDAMKLHDLPSGNLHPSNRQSGDSPGQPKATRPLMRPSLTADLLARAEAAGALTRERGSHAAGLEPNSRLSPLASSPAGVGAQRSSPTQRSSRGTVPVSSFLAAAE